MIKRFEQTEIWHPAYHGSSIDQKKQMDFEALSPEAQANIFCENEGIKPISITATTEISGGYNSVIKSKRVLYILY